jgi:hypothetical protein
MRMLEPRSRKVVRLFRWSPTGRNGDRSNIERHAQIETEPSKLDTARRVLMSPIPGPTTLCIIPHSITRSIRGNKSP